MMLNKAEEKSERSGYAGLRLRSETLDYSQDSQNAGTYFSPLSSCFVLDYISVFPHKRVPEPLVTLVKTLKFRTMSRAYWDT